MEKNYLILSLLILSSCAVLVVGQRTGELRLAGFESTKLMGRLELFASGGWFGICNDQFGARELAVACRQLGLGNGVYVYNPDTDALNKTNHGNSGRTDPKAVRFGYATILIEVSCVGTENYLLNCAFFTTHDCRSYEAVAVQCSEYRPQPYSGQVRLVGGDYPSEGIVQVYFNGEWGIVCDPGFDGNAALAVCRQLGYSDGSASIGATSYGSPTGPVWVTSLSCGGSEKCLSSCLSSAPSSPGSCSANGFATVACGYGRVQVDNQPKECEMSSTPGEGSLRLVDVRGAPQSGANGTLQVYMNGRWGGFCGLASKSDRESWDVMCRQLGYRTWASARASRIPGGTMHITDISCTGVEDNVFGCQYGNTSMSQCGNTYLLITCNPDLFAVSMYGSVIMLGTADGAGSLFVRGSGGFGPICDEDFDLVDGEVACRQMGYEGVYAVPKGSYYGGFRVSPALTHITCEGSENRLLSCNHRRDSTQLCTPNSFAGVHCTANASDTNRGSLRLADGNSSSGVLEISLDGRWWAVCFRGFSTAAANVACRQLGFSDGAVGYTSGQFRDSGVADAFTVTGCRGPEQRLYDCFYITLPRTNTDCPTGVILTCDSEVCSPSKEEMCSSIFGLRNQTLSPSSTSGSCSVSESCTTLSCTLTVVYTVFNIPLSLETTFLPCSDPYGVHLLITSSLLGGEVVNDTFTQSRNLTISVLGSDADVIVDIKQQCYGLTLSIKVFLLGNMLEFMSPTDLYMFCPPPPEVNCSFSQPSYSVTEGGTVNVTILTSSAGFSFPFTVTLSYMDGSAEQNVDYIQSVTTVDFSPGQSSATFTVATVEDNRLETLENFKIMIVGTSEPDMAAVGSPNMVTIAIEDNDVALTLSIRPQNYTVVEGQTVNITLELDSDAFDDEFNVTLVHRNTSATAPGDYMSGPYTVMFRPGQRTAILMVPTVNDSIAELTESFKVMITSTSTPDKIVVGDPDTSYVTIVDNDVITCSKTSGNTTITEGDTVELTVECSGESEFDFTLFLDTMDGSAIAPGDYTSGGYSLSFSAGQTSATLSVQTSDNTIAELEEFFKVMITRSDRPDKVIIGDPDICFVAIQDDDAIEVLIRQNYTVTEGGVVNIVVEVNSTDYEFDFTVTLNHMNGSAGAPGDYVPGPYQVSFSAGQPSATLSIQTENDDIAELTEYFKVMIVSTSKPDRVDIGDPDTSYVTIVDNDVVTCSKAPENATVTEGEIANLTIVCSGEYQFDFTLFLDTMDGSAVAPGDYTSGGYSLSFSVGQTSAILSVPTLDDNDAELEEFFKVMITRSNRPEKVLIGDPDIYFVTIQDNDVVSCSKAPENATVTEGEIANLTIVCSGGYQFDFTLFLDTMDGSAVAPGDYTSGGYSLSFSAGQTSAILSVPTLDDNDAELEEFFKVMITRSNRPDKVIIGDPDTGYITIEDNDVLTVRFVAEQYSVVEGSGAVVNLRITANKEVTFPFNVPVDTMDGNATVDDGDYTPGGYVARFTPGSRRTTVAVNISDDSKLEGDEYFTSHLSLTDELRNKNVRIGSRNTATIVIEDDEREVSISFSPATYTVSEGDGQVTIKLVASRTLQIEYVVNVEITGGASQGMSRLGGSAADPEDYANSTYQVVFPSGDRSAPVKVPINDDDVCERNETFVVMLDIPKESVVYGVRTGTPMEATVTIRDNDIAEVQFDPTTYEVTEGDAVVSISVDCGACSRNYTVGIACLDGTASSIVDYFEPTSVVTCLSGHTTSSIDVIITDDSVNEPTENFTCSFTNLPEGVSVGSNRVATVVITDDDEVAVTSSEVVTSSQPSSSPEPVLTETSTPSPSPTTSLVVESTEVTTSTPVVTSSEADVSSSSPEPISTHVPTPTEVTTSTPVVTSSEVDVSSSSPEPISTHVPTPTSAPSGVELSFESSQYSTREGSVEGVVTIGLSANSATGFTYTVEISVNDINTTAGSDYNVTTLNVMMRAGETRAMFSVGIIDDEVVERREAFQCTVSRINTPSQDIPIEWDRVPVTVIIEDDDDFYISVFLRNYSSRVSENVSHVPITILSYSIAAFEYTVDLYVENGGSAEEGSDFELPEVVFRPYQRSATVNVLIIDDEIREEVEKFTIRGTIVAPDHGLVEVNGSVAIEIMDDDSCQGYFIFPRTTVGEVATVPCSTDGSGSGMYGNIESKCEEGGVWGSVDMSQCTFRRDVPSRPILWMVELRSTNLTSLKQMISDGLGQDQVQNVNVNEQGRSSNSDRSVYFIQALNDHIVNSTRSVISSKLIRETIIMRKNGCNCCENAKIDLFNSKSNYAEICEGEGNIQVPCSCLNDENKCAAFYVDEDSKCYLDTDRDSKPDVNDSCIECCPEEFNIFLWPKRDYGVTVEANCSEIHPSFGGSKVSRTCRQNDIWDPVDISSCTFKNTTGSTPIILFNATVNGSNINEAREILREQARNLVPGNASAVNVTVTEVATVNTTTNQTVVIFVIEFTENTTLVENFTTAIKEPSIALKYVQAVIPAGSCSCSSNRSDELRRLCIGTATAPCDCDQGANCECVDPYFREPGGTCTLDTDGDKIADYKDLCPYEYGESCPKPPPVLKCPSETDSTWKLFWRDTVRGTTLYTRCPGGVNVSAGLASRECGKDGTWGEVDTINCISRAFQDIEQRRQDVKQVLKTENVLTNKQREVITGITQDLSAALNVDNTLSVLPRDLTTTTNLVEELASLSDNNGLFSGQNNTEQQMAVVGVISGVLNSKNVPAFRANSKSQEQETPAESLLESTELLTRTGFVQQDQSLPPSDAPPSKTEKVVVDTNLVVQSNRLNSLSFTSPSFQVSFPSQEFNNFARSALIPTIVIPGSFLNALTKGGSDVRGTQTPVPADSTTTLLTPSAVSPTTSQTPPTTPPTVPTTDTNNQTIAKPVDVVSFTMNNLQELLPLRLSNQPNKSDGARPIRIEPVSLILSSQVAGVENTAVDSGETIELSFTLLENAQNITVGLSEEKRVQCAFWDFADGRNGSGGWSFDGIETVFDNETHVQCKSKHLTSFVVLVSVVPIDDPLPFFAWITYIGCGISLLCLLLSIVFFLALRKELISRLHNFVHLNLCIALSCGLIFFLGGMEHAAEYKIACQIVSVFQHYFFLAAFCWMLCEAVMIYILLVRVFGANDKKWIYLYLVLGWGLPVPVVVVSVAVRHYNYFILNTNNEILACWLPVTDGLIAAFIGPMLAILLVNAILLTISMASLAKSKCGKNKEMGQDKKENAQTAWQLTKATLILMPLMGFTWVIGLLAVGPGRDVVAIVFVVLNSLQGLFIFLLHVVRHEKVWSKIKARMPTLKGKKFTLLTGPSSETKSTLTRSPKKTAFTSKSFSSTGGHDVGLFGIESKEKPDDLASIKDGEDFEMKIKNGESTLDEQKVEVTATTFGIGEPNGKEDKTTSSPQPTESKPEQTTTTFGIGEQNDNKKEDNTTSSPQPTESEPLLEPTASDQSPPPTTTSSGSSPTNVTVEYHSPGESDQPPCGGEAL